VILYGLAVAWSQPTLAGWDGSWSSPAPTTITRVLTIIFPTVITLWLVEMNIVVLRKAPVLERAITQDL
jgi:hypothetical protein